MNSLYQAFMDFSGSILTSLGLESLPHLASLKVFLFDKSYSMIHISNNVSASPHSDSDCVLIRETSLDKKAITVWLLDHLLMGALRQAALKISSSAGKDCCNSMILSQHALCHQHMPVCQLPSNRLSLPSTCIEVKVFELSSIWK